MESINSGKSKVVTRGKKEDDGGRGAPSKRIKARSEGHSEPKTVVKGTSSTNTKHGSEGTVEQKKAEKEVKGASTSHQKTKQGGSESDMEGKRQNKG